MKNIAEKEGERAGKEGRPSCKQHNANESLAKAQSCSERVPLTKPPELVQPSLTNQKRLVLQKMGGERESEKTQEVKGEVGGTREEIGEGEGTRAGLGINAFLLHQLNPNDYTEIVE